jgi:hypothetical protein
MVSVGRPSRPAPSATTSRDVKEVYGGHRIEASYASTVDDGEWLASRSGCFTAGIQLFTRRKETG